MLNFEEVKKIRITDVVGRYGIKLRFKGEWANAPCPLPSHRDGDKGRNFTINVPQNYWRCFSESCNEKNSGRRGGDVINLVSAMEGCRERHAALKLAEWFHLNRHAQEQKTGLHMGSRVSGEAPEGTHQKDSLEGSKSGDSRKGYIQAVDAWFDEVFGLRPDQREEEYWKKARNAVKSKLIESYKNGKLGK
jgi:hypothetical protein